MTDHAHLEPLLTTLVGVCGRFTARMEAVLPTMYGGQADDRLTLVRPEPYIPYLPSKAPEVLVLGEAQNLSEARQKKYATYLAADSTTPRMRFLRLLDGKRVVDEKDNGIGVQPWDDGTLKIAVRASLGIDPSTVAVSNALPWSWTDGGVNARPFTGPLIDLAGEFLGEMLMHINPKLVIAAGGNAQKVMARATRFLSNKGWPVPRILPWTLPSPRLDAVAGMFDARDLMARYDIPEDIRQDVLKNRKLGRRWAVYICHAVSKTRDHLVLQGPS